ncbi:PH domain-containing protein [Leuconostoc falkenbergense]|uniref:PH domain-containing protein n=1 Tax=Leuconostoc falkenbergense TaxID=2766470 RepID=UPI00295849EA|nr:PH domain-containing protein [Leuconostoc falkenbergense]MDV8951570.1 PH domain-containing protein [Leuconostoc falkenbergense]
MTKQHQSWFAIVVNFFSHIKIMIWPIILGLFNIKNDGVIFLPLIVLGIFVVFIGSAWIQWLFFTFEFDDNELSVKQGIFNKKQVHVPFERIQTISRTMPFYYQPFQSVRLQIDTSGQGKPEVVFDALSLTQADIIEQKRRSAQNKKTSVEEIRPKQSISELRYHVTNRDLMLYAVTSLGGLGGFLALFTLWTQIDDILPKHLKATVTDFVNHQSMIVLSSLIVIGLFIGIVVGFFRIYNQYFDFKVLHEENHLVISRGLLARKSVQLKFSRIQAVQLRQTLLRRMVKLMSANVLLSASRDEDDKKTVLIPVVSSQKATTTLQKVLGVDDFDIKQWQPSAIKTAAWYQVRFSLLRLATMIVVLSGIVMIWLPKYWDWHNILLGILIALVLVGFLILKNIMTIKDQKIGYCESAIYLQRSNGLTKEGYFITRDKIQGLNMHGLYTLAAKKATHLDIIVRDDNGGHTIRLRYVPEQTITVLNKWLFL